MINFGPSLTPMILCFALSCSSVQLTRSLSVPVCQWSRCCSPRWFHSDIITVDAMRSNTDGVYYVEVVHENKTCGKHIKAHTNSMFQSGHVWGPSLISHKPVRGVQRLMDWVIMAFEGAGEISNIALAFHINSGVSTKKWNKFLQYYWLLTADLRNLSSVLWHSANLFWNWSQRHM